MEIGIKTGDLMTRNFVYVSPKTTLKECAEVMIKKRVGSLIIKEGDNLWGILTEKDIIWAIVKKSVKDLRKISAKDIAKRKVITIKPSSDAMEALNKMKSEKIRRLPVTENGKVIGMLTLNDILKIEPGLFELFAENFKVKEETEKLRSVSSANRKQGICQDCGKTDILYDCGGESICISCYTSR